MLIEYPFSLSLSQNIGSIKNDKNIQYTTKFPIGHELRFPDQPHGNLPAV